MTSSVFKNTILWFCILCSVNFFQLQVVGVQIVSKAEMIGIALFVAVISVYSLIPLGDKKVRRNFSMPLNFLFFSIVISSLGALALHNQPMPYTIIASRILFYYLFYHVLHVLKPTKEKLISIILITAVLYFFIYAIQYLIYPRQILITQMVEERAKVRIRLSGYTFCLFGILFSTYTYNFLNNKLRYIIVSILGSMFLIFLSTRILILSTYLVQVLIFLQNKSKAIIGLAILGFVSVLIAPAVINKIDPQLIDNLIKHTENDQSKQDDYIRLVALHYYSDKMRKQPSSYITGHGNPTGGENFTSDYSNETNIEKQSGLFLDDLGQFGSYYRYGIAYILFILFLYYKLWNVFRKKQLMEIGFIKYFFLVLLLVSITIPLFVTHTDSIILICISLYIIDITVPESSEVDSEVIYE